MRMMVVDDDKNIRNILLFGMGKVTVCNRVAACVSAEEALDVFKPGDYDCLIVDYKLPGMNGIEFIKKVRRLDGKVGIVLVTAVLDQKTAEIACEGLSVYSVIQKPFELKDISQKVSEAAELSRMPEVKERELVEAIDAQSSNYKDLGAQIRREVQARRSDTSILKRKMVL